jgi:hypothetical protein
MILEPKPPRELFRKKVSDGGLTWARMRSR